MARTIILIPARLASVRLPGKPLAELAGEPMIVHVWRRALAANIGRVVVATDTPAIAAAVTSRGGEAFVTAQDHASGSDRIAEALAAIDPENRYDTILNLQGDLPTLHPGCIKAVCAALQPAQTDIATLAAPILDAAERENPNVVKVVGSELPSGNLRALYFTRAAAPWGRGPLHHHIGIYAYRRAALMRFVALPPSPLERREGLEQLRALEAGLRIDVALVDTVPLGVDTPADLERARRMLEPR